ncbi:hypothetical protein Misp02_05610 [Microtetraspora sp. NBRC 16547]|nr:hypothetical protein Misp02_05610 [Microtetraspora sp. NBRC 16547]
MTNCVTVTGMPESMEVQAGEADLLRVLRPVGRPAEVASPEDAAPRASDRPDIHILGMGASYVLLLTGFYTTTANTCRYGTDFQPSPTGCSRP